MTPLNENEEKFVNHLIKNLQLGIDTGAKGIDRLKQIYNIDHYAMQDIREVLRKRVEAMWPDVEELHNHLSIDAYREIYALNAAYVRPHIVSSLSYEDVYDQETASIMRLADYATGDSMRKRAERAAKEKREARIALWIMIGVMAFFMLLGLIFGS